MMIDKVARAARQDTGAPRRVRDREATIRAVLESAQRLFSTKGYDRTSLVDIAAETGLSPRGVILHFSSKADIAAELLLRELRARVHGYRGDGGGSAIGRIQSFFSWMAEGDRRTFINFPALWAFSARWSVRVEAKIAEVTTELLAPVRKAIVDGIANGEFRRIDPTLACEVLWNNYLSGLRKASIHGGKPADALSSVERAISLLRA